MTCRDNDVTRYAPLFLDFSGCPGLSALNGKNSNTVLTLYDRKRRLNGHEIIAIYLCNSQIRLKQVGGLRLHAFYLYF